MKKLFTLFFFLCSILIGKAQVVNPQFENATSLSGINYFGSTFSHAWSDIIEIISQIFSPPTMVALIYF